MKEITGLGWRTSCPQEDNTQRTWKRADYNVPENVTERRYGRELKSERWSLSQCDISSTLHSQSHFVGTY